MLGRTSNHFVADAAPVAFDKFPLILIFLLAIHLPALNCMIKNYLSVAMRNIRQSPLYAFINVFSLAIGLACCTIIYLFIKDEKSQQTFDYPTRAIKALI